MSKLAHILAIEIQKPDFIGFNRTDPFTFIDKGDVFLGYRPHLEELDPENNDSEKATLQFIPYVVVKHKGNVLAYVRPNAGNEARLHGKVSVGLGGHVDLADVEHEDSVIDIDKTLRTSCVRELEEEISLSLDPEQINWAGLIYRTDGPVDRVHLGIVAEIEIDDETEKSIRASKETGELKFVNPSEIEAEMAEYEIEAWTKAVLEID